VLTRFSKSGGRTAGTNQKLIYIMIHLSIAAKSINSELFSWSFQAWKKFRQDVSFPEFYRSMCIVMVGYDFLAIPYNTKRALKRLSSKQQTAARHND